METIKTAEELLTMYWEIAYSEGKTGVSRGSEAQEVLSALQAALADSQQASSAPVAQQVPFAYLKIWSSVGNAQHHRRVDLTADCEQWLANMFPTVTPLYTARQLVAPAGPGPGPGPGPGLAVGAQPLPKSLAAMANAAAEEAFKYYNPEGKVKGVCYEPGPSAAFWLRIYRAMRELDPDALRGT